MLHKSRMGSFFKPCSHAGVILRADPLNPRRYFWRGWCVGVCVQATRWQSILNRPFDAGLIADHTTSKAIALNSRHGCEGRISECRDWVYDRTVVTSMLPVPDPRLWMTSKRSLIPDPISTTAEPFERVLPEWVCVVSRGCSRVCSLIHATAVALVTVD